MRPTTPRSDDIPGPYDAVTVDRLVTLLEQPKEAPLVDAAGMARADRSGRSEPALHWSERAIVWAACIALTGCLAVFAYFLYTA